MTTDTIVRPRRARLAAGGPVRNPLVPTLIVLAWAILTTWAWLYRRPLPRYGYPALLLGVPLVSTVVFVASRSEWVRAVFARFAAGTSLVAAAIIGASVAGSLSLLVAGVAGATALVRRRPRETMAALFVLSGSYGSLYVFTPIHPAIVVQLAILGLWITAFAWWLRAPRRPRFVLVPGVLLVVAYVFLTIAGLPFLSNGIGPVRSFLSSVWLMSVFIVIAYGPWSKDTITWMVRFAVVVALLVGAYATLRWITGPAGREQVYMHEASVYGLVAEGAGGAKVIGSFPNGPALGAWSATALPFCVALILFGPRRMRLLAVGLPLMLIGLLGSGNRGSLVAAVAGVACVIGLALVSRANIHSRFAKVCAFGLGAVLCGALLFPAVLGDNPTKSARYAKILTPSRDPSFNARIQKWRAALSDAPHYPFGHGFGTASPGTRRIRFPSPAADNVDSAYIQVAYEQGIPVMVLFVAALLCTLFTIARRATRAVEAESAVVGIGAAGTLTAFLVVCIAGQFQYELNALGTWVIVGVGLWPFVRLDSVRAGT